MFYLYNILKLVCGLILTTGTISLFCQPGECINTNAACVQCTAGEIFQIFLLFLFINISLLQVLPDLVTPRLVLTVRVLPARAANINPKPWHLPAMLVHLGHILTQEQQHVRPVQRVSIPAQVLLHVLIVKVVPIRSPQDP